MKKLLLVVAICGLASALPGKAMAATPTLKVHPDSSCALVGHGIYFLSDPQNTPREGCSAEAGGTYQCDWEREWGTFDGAPVAKMYLVSGHCSLIAPEDNVEVDWNNSAGGGSDEEYGITHFGTPWTQATDEDYVPGDTLSEACWQVALNDANNEFTEVCDLT